MAQVLVADSRSKGRIGVFSLLLALVMVVTSTPAMAATVTYWDDWAGPNVWINSGINDIYGGIAETVPYNVVYIRTTTSFYPYYLYVESSADGYVSMTHSTYNPARSRCKINPFAEPLECRYKT
jgi:hypothetical protein